MPRIFAAATLLVLIATASPLFLVETSSAGTDYTVTRSDDPPADGCQPGDCSFREAAAAAAAGGTIVVPSGTHVALTQNRVELSGNVIVEGAGPGNSSIGGNGTDPVLLVNNATATIRNLKIAGGASSVCGAGITNRSDLTLENVLVTDNHSTGQGGGICNDVDATLTLTDGTVIDGNSAHSDPAGGGVMNHGTLTVTDATISNNEAIGTNGGGDGAGIANTGTATISHALIEGNSASSAACDDCSSGAGIDNDGILELEYSFISENEADAAAGLQNNLGADATVRRSLFAGNNGGAILNGGTGATMLISNSTISSNFGKQKGQGPGGIANTAALSIVNSTITNNTAFQFLIGGVHNISPTGSVDYKATILSNNGPNNCGTAGTHTSNGFNVFDDDSCATIGSDQPDTDPMIGPLQDNDGPTLSHYLQAGSPAIDAGGPGCPTPDQLGALRVGGCDAGAVEFGGVVPTPSPTPSPTPAPVTYPMGDTTCNDGIGTDDLAESLRLAGELSEPDFCGRLGGCVDVGGTCHPNWSDTNCDGLINALDSLWIALHLVGSPEPPPVSCWPIGTYEPK